MRVGSWIAVASCLLAACSSFHAGIPRFVRSVPDAGSPVDEVVRHARELADRGADHAALEHVAQALRRDPRHVDANRVRQDVLRARGRLGLVLTEAERRLTEWGVEDPDALYLLGRVQRSNQAKREVFERVLERDPTSFWGWLGLAFTYRVDRREQSIAIYRRLYELTDAHPVVAIALASTLRVGSESDEALEIYEALRGVPGAAGVGELGIVETKLGLGKRSESFGALHAALRTRPFDPGVRRVVETMMSQGLSRGHVERIVDVLFEDPERFDAFGTGEGAVTLARLLERLGKLPVAEALLASRDRLATSTFERRHTRRQRLARGDVRGFLELLRQDFPRAFLADERNRVRGLWIALLDGRWSRAPDPLASSAAAAEFGTQLVRAGLLDEAETVLSIAAARHGADARVASLLDETRREIAFESALREILYSGYQHPDLSLDSVLEALRGESVRILGRDVVGAPVKYAIPLVGELVDTFDSDLGRHLAKYNRHLVLGKRWVGPPEGLLLTRLSDRELDPGGPLPLPARCREIVGDDRRVRSLTSVLGGDLAGVALLGHYVIDFDAVRDWARSIHERRRIAREDELALLEDPLPDGVDPLEPVDVESRLCVLSPVADDDLEAAVFDMIAAHERAHLVDSYHYLPPAANLLRVLGLLFRHAFQPLSIEAQMEARAEAGALLASEHPELVLAHIVGFLGAEDPNSPHAIGFTRLARSIQRFLERDGRWQHDTRVSRWHLVPPDLMRAAAARFLRR